MKRYISIDIGGTAIKYGIIGEDAKIMLKKSMPTEAGKGGPAILDKVIGIVNEMLVSHSEIAGICISTAGMVDTETGSIFYSAPLIPNYAGTQFKKILEEKFQIPCEVENDVNCAGLAEYRNGAAKGSKVALVLTIGTGIGGCILLEGKVFHGFSNSACEVGYMHMDDSDFQTLGAANICYVLNPEIVVLGGGIMAQETFLKDRIKGAVKKYLVSSIEKHTKITFAENQNDAGMLGAFYHFCGMHLKE